MTDRELLEAAAKAAELTIHARNQAARDACGAGDVGLWISNKTTCWNPLTDDGDRYRLAKRLDIRIHFGPCYVTFSVHGESRVLRWPEDVSNDAYAIVSAAAAIGGAQP